MAVFFKKMELFFEKAEMFLTRSGFYLKSAILGEYRLKLMLKNWCGNSLIQFLEYALCLPSVHPIFPKTSVRGSFLLYG